jgi:hypothetical protein
MFTEFCQNTIELSFGFVWGINSREQSPFERLIAAQLVVKSPPFMQSEKPKPFSQEPAIEPCLETDESNPEPPTLFTLYTV